MDLWVCKCKGGKLIIGQNDKGEFIGIEKYKKLMDDIPNKIQNQLGIICDVDLKDIKGKNVLKLM
jgi:ATP-dependent DNA helicase RecG